MTAFRPCVAALLLPGGVWARVNWPGVLLLLIGAALGFFADRLCERFSPDEPQRAVLYRFAGLALAFAGTLIAVLA